MNMISTIVPELDVVVIVVLTAFQDINTACGIDGLASGTAALVD